MGYRILSNTKITFIKKKNNFPFSSLFNKCLVFIALLKKITFLYELSSLYRNYNYIFNTLIQTLLSVIVFTLKLSMILSS